MSGDPTYITSYNGARSLIMKMERDELVEEMLKTYIEHNRMGIIVYENYGAGLRLEDGGRSNERSTWHYCTGESRRSGRKDENKLRKTCARIEELISEYEVERIVLGFPKHMNNDVGEQSREVSRIRRDAKAPYRAGSRDVGRASYDSGSRAYFDRE